VYRHPVTPLREACPYFDRGPYRMIRATAFPHMQIYGGVRERVFKMSPTISKVPLVRWKAGMRFLLSAHAVSPIRLASTTGALLHYKFLADFYERAKIEVAREEHFSQASEYKAYAAVLAEQDELNLFGSDSVQF